MRQQRRSRCQSVPTLDEVLLELEELEQFGEES